MEALGGRVREANDWYPGWHVARLKASGGGEVGNDDDPGSAATNEPDSIEQRSASVPVLAASARARKDPEVLALMQGRIP